MNRKGLRFYQYSGLLDGVAIEGRNIPTPGLYFSNCRDLTIRNARIKGFKGCAVFAKCANVTLENCIFEGSSSHNVIFRECIRVAVNRCISTDAWLDGFKLIHTEKWSFNNVESSFNGTSKNTDPTSNGNGIDTYPSSQYGTINGGSFCHNEGAGINIKTGPKDNDKPTSHIRINNPHGENNAGPLIDINSTSSRINRQDPSEYDASIPRNIHIDGLSALDNGTQTNPRGQSVRIGHGRNVLTTGQFVHNGIFHVTSESDVTKKHVEARP